MMEKEIDKLSFLDAVKKNLKAGFQDICILEHSSFI